MDVRTEFLTVRMTVSVPRNGVSVKGLEELCVAAARETFVAAARAMQESYQRREAARLERREWRERWVATRLGMVRVPLLKVRDRATGRTGVLGRDLLQLGPREGMSEWLAQRAVALRLAGLSYRQSAAVLRAFEMAVGSAMRVWRLVQVKGAACVAAEAARAAAVAAAPTVPLCVPPPALYLEADEIYLNAQRSAQPHHRVKVGLSYTGRARQRGRVPRYRLAGKRWYGGVGSFAAFGEGWRTHLEWHHAVSHARAVLYLSDGDAGLAALRERCFPHAIGQLDWAHVFRDLAAAAPDEACGRRWVAHVAAGRADLTLQSLRRHRRHPDGNAVARAKVTALLATRPAELYGWQQFRRRYDPQRQLRLPRGTGGIEKNQEITIGRVMKRRGMAWTERGAHHLVKLIFAQSDPPIWNSLWLEPVPPLT